MTRHLHKISTFLAAAALVAAAALTGCAHTMDPEQLDKRAFELSPARSFSRSTTASLDAFGKMVRAYVGAPELTIVEVDYIPNGSGVTKELPVDMGFYVVSSLGHMGEPFRTTRSYPAIITHGTSAASGVSLQPRAIVPPTVKLNGELLRASQTVERKRGVRGDVNAKVGSGTLDSAVNVGDETVITHVRLGFMLSSPQGVSLSTPGATYDIKVTKQQDNLSLGVYFDGTGLGYTSDVVVTHDTGAAIYDATASCMMHLMGNWLMVPYYRCDKNLPVDTKLKERLRAKLRATGTAELERRIKILMFGSALPVDSTQAGMTVADRAILHEEMRKLAFVPNARDAALNHASLIKYYVHLWETMDYEQAAERVEGFMAELSRQSADRPAPLPAITSKPSAQSPTTTGPAAATRVAFTQGAERDVIFLDLVSVDDHSTRARILKGMLQVPGCEDINFVDHMPGIYRLKYTGERSVLQLALRKNAFGMNVSWEGRRVTVTPRVRK